MTLIIRQLIIVCLSVKMLMTLSEKVDHEPKERSLYFGDFWDSGGAFDGPIKPISVMVLAEAAAVRCCGSWLGGWTAVSKR